MHMLPRLSCHSWLLAAAAVIVAGITVPLTVFHGSGQPLKAAAAAGAPSSPSPGPYICNQPILDSPWYYHGSATKFTSGQYPGLPTYGSAGTNFPDATAGVIIPAGDNTAAGQAGDFNANNTVFFWEPGDHTFTKASFGVGDHSYYIGGWTAALGEATLDGVNGAAGPSDVAGNSLEVSQPPGAGKMVADTWEYLTIKNFLSGNNDAVMGDTYLGGDDAGNTYKYNTIGPNEYVYEGPASAPALNTFSAPGQGGGYAINAASYTTIEYNCITQDAQGAYNVSSSVDVSVDNNEISYDGLGEYPDVSGTSGSSPSACGCSGGGKMFTTVNASVVNNYIHDNYNVGIWFDWQNTGTLISHNYIASNWANGIDDEVGYNANISDNTLVGNGWASHGAWPGGYNGGDCNAGWRCSVGAGPIGGSYGFPYEAIYLPNSGGNALFRTVKIPSSIVVPGCSSNCTVLSRYPGTFTVSSNVLMNNFGGVMAYTDTNRYPGNIDNDSSCGVPFGSLSSYNIGLYYQQGAVLVTNADADISGSSVTTAGGTQSFCDDYAKSPQGSANGTSLTVNAPTVGMAVYNQKTGAYLGKVLTVTSANAFTLDTSPGDVTGASLLLSAYGGCGPADYFGGRPGISTGSPSKPYWDNCIWGSRNVTVTGNVFSLDAGTVSYCTSANLCGYQALIAFNAGVPDLMQFWDSYQTYIAEASGGLGNIWSDNSYTWTGGGPGRWSFQAGLQGNSVTRSQWQSAPYSQDAGSTFNY